MRHKPHGSAGQRRRTLTNASSRAGVSLVEILAALALIGVMAIAAARPMRHAAQSVADARSSADQLRIDLLRCRRYAINTGVPHRIVFQRTGGLATSYAVMEGNRVVDSPVVISSHTRCTAGSDIEFRADGAVQRGADVIYAVVSTRTKTSSAWKVSLDHATGLTRVTRTFQ